MRRRLLFGLVAAGVFVWLLVAGMTLLAARNATRDGTNTLERARGVLTPEGIVDGAGLDLLNEANADFERAHDKVRSAWIAPLRVLPVVGRQVRSVDALTSAASNVTEVGIDAMDSARAVLDRVPSDGPARVAVSSELAAISASSSERLEDVDLGPSRALLSPLRDARRRFEEELAGLRDSTARLRDGSAAFVTFLQGPSRYLLLAANNNEMRIGSGTFLSIGQLDVTNGQLTIGEMRPTTDFPVPAGAVTIDGDVADRWGWLEPQYEWRNLGATPRFDTQAELAARMWKAATGVEVDGVLALDPVALRALLVATGPVVVDGVEYSAGNVLDELYLGQYLELGDGDVSQVDRRDRLAAIAQAAIAQFDKGEWEVSELVDALRDAAAGRHVLAWARDETVQRGWEAARSAGVLEPDSLAVGVHNRGGNKLDQFLDVAAALDVTGERAEIEIELANNAPAGLPDYVAGRYAGARGGAPGLYQGLLVFELPPGVGNAVIVDAEGEELEPVALGPDGTHSTIAAYVEVPRGARARYTLRAELHPATDRLRIEPSARVPAVSWTFRSDTWTDEQARTVRF